MNANTIARSHIRDIRAHLFDAPRHFVSERQWQIVDPGNAGAIMRIRVTDSGRLNANQDLIRTNLRNWNLRILERLSDLDESCRSHFAINE
jgi:hypothetical protein